MKRKRQEIIEFVQACFVAACVVWWWHGNVGKEILVCIRGVRVGVCGHSLHRVRATILALSLSLFETRQEKKNKTPPKR